MQKLSQCTSDMSVLLHDLQLLMISYISDVNNDRAMSNIPRPWILDVHIHTTNSLSVHDSLFRTLASIIPVLTHTHLHLTFFAALFFESLFNCLGLILVNQAALLLVLSFFTPATLFLFFKSLASASHSIFTHLSLYTLLKTIYYHNVTNSLSRLVMP